MRFCIGQELFTNLDDRAKDGGFISAVRGIDNAHKMI
jgi:hypothetical protein